MGKKTFVVLFILSLSWMTGYVWMQKSLDVPYKNIVEAKDKDMEKVDKRIKRLLDNNDYKNADIKTRKKLAGKVLKKLKSKGFVKKYRYIKDEQMYSFVYQSGASGGIRLTEFEEYFN